MTNEKVQELIDSLFEEQALALGGLVAVHGLSDDLVWQLVESMDVIRGRVLRRLEVSRSGAVLPGLGKTSAKPHPAIQEFLSRLLAPGERLRCETP